MSSVVLLCRMRLPPIFAPGFTPRDEGTPRDKVFFFFAPPTVSDCDLDIDIVDVFVVPLVELLRTVDGEA